MPGLIDPHEHLLVGSGEQGFSSQTPELHLSEIVCAGITTVIGCLGVDTTMKTMAAQVLKLKDRGKLELQMKADVLVLDRETLELREVIARGRRLLKDGKPAAVEAFIEDSNRSIQLVGKEAQD